MTEKLSNNEKNLSSNEATGSNFTHASDQLTDFQTDQNTYQRIEKLTSDEKD